MAVKDDLPENLVKNFGVGLHVPRGADSMAYLPTKLGSFGGK